MCPKTSARTDVAMNAKYSPPVILANPVAPTRSETSKGVILVIVHISLWRLDIMDLLELACSETCRLLTSGYAKLSRRMATANALICRVALVQHCARDRSKRPGSGVFDAARRPGAELEPVLVDRFTAHVALPVGAVGQLGLGAQHGVEGGVERLRGRSVGHLLDRLGRALAAALAEPDRRAVGDWRRQPLDGAPQVGFLRVEFRPHPRQVEIRHPAIMPRMAWSILPMSGLRCCRRQMSMAPRRVLQK